MSVLKNIDGGRETEAKSLCETAENEAVPESAPTKQIPLPRLKSTSTVGSNEEKRSTWDKKREFFLSCVGYAVGLGNIWRFPYLCYKNGGGAFFIPYFFCLVVCGIPVFFLEMSLGQFASLGPISIWKISPLFEGLGYGMAIVSAIACIYYNVIIAWSLFYIFSSYLVSWASCENAWNTPTCISGNNSTWETTNATSEEYGFVYTSIENATEIFKDLLPVESKSNVGALTASEEFWFFNVLNKSSGIQDIGELQWHLVLCLFIAWIMVFFCVIKGVKSSGKVVYVTATFPYVVLLILFVRTVSLPGAWNGIKFYLNPDWKLLLRFQVWIDAASQVFYSLGVGWGALITMASHNKFNNNVYRDSMCIPIINCVTSILAGFVVFSIIGFMAYETGKNIEDVVEQGPGLAFIVYPQAVALFPHASFWAFLFFVMLLFVGLDTQFAMFETAISALLDVFPVLRKWKIAFIAFACFVFFLLGLPCVTQGGMYIVSLMDHYCAAFTLMFIGLLETIMITWFYGIDRFLQDIFLMTNKLPSKWWKLCWCVFTPATITVLLLSMIIQHTAVVYGSYIYPYWSSVIGWNLAICSAIPIPVVAIIRLWKTKGTFMERFIKKRRPVPEWGPVLEEDRIRYQKSLLEVPSKFLQFGDLTIVLTDASATMDLAPTDVSAAMAEMPADASKATSLMPTYTSGAANEMLQSNVPQT